MDFKNGRRNRKHGHCLLLLFLLLLKMVRKYFYPESADVYPGIVARNKAVVDYEKFIQRTFHPYIIHPYSKFSVRWQQATVFLIGIQTTTVSIPWATLNHGSIIYHLIILLYKIQNLLDVILTFFTGYVDSKTETIILDAKKIAKRYLFTTFLFDAIPCVPIEFISYLSAVDRSKHYMGSSGIFHHVADIWTISVILRIVTCVRYLRNLCKILLWNTFLVGCLTVAWVFYSCLLFSGSLFFIVPKITEKTKPKVVTEPEEIGPRIFLHDDDYNDDSKHDFYAALLAYIKALLNIVLDCLYYDTIEPLTYIYARSFVLVISFFASLLFMAFFVKYALLLMFPMEKTIEFKNSVICFLRNRHLPTPLRNKTLLYFYFLRESKYAKEQELFNYISDVFKGEMYNEVCLPLLKNFYPFEEFPTYVLRCFAERLKYQLHLPNELVTNTYSSLSMYFVLRGTVAYYSTKRIEVYHFEGGSSFNGRNCVLGVTSSKTYAVSIEVTEIYRLDHDDFVKIMEMYPQLLQEAQDKLKRNRTESACLLE